MSDTKCAYSYEDYFGREVYPCNMEAWSVSELNQCIFHSTIPNKPSNLFFRKLKKQLKGNGANNKNNFIGYHFPRGNWDENFKAIEFDKEVYFNNAHFEGEVYFTNVCFNNKVHFDRIVVNNAIGFINSNFKESINMTNLSIEGLYLDKTNFEKKVDFRNSNFGLFTAKKTNFKKEAIFINSVFNSASIFDDAIFESDVQFYNAKFKGKTSFDNVSFFRKAEFDGVNFETEISCEETKFKKLKDKENLYRKARLFWEDYGDRGKADEYFKKERIAKRKQIGPKFDDEYLPLELCNNYATWLSGVIKNIKWHDFFGWKNYFLKRLPEYFFADFITGYGTNWLKILRISIISILIYAFNYLNLDILNHELTGIIESVYFSIVTFTTLGYGDIAPKNQLGQLITSSESLLGTFLIAAFLAVFSRKFMR